ncbi:ATP-dependent nuclease [Pectobacterium versatile]|uniref:ATP-dependent nuclease n=1 Tax=Pectobacterium versatile TaxID=2488639 RepID=UPI001F3A0CA1|nr:AAA family ATPase [Pectobacterium versatile]
MSISAAKIKDCWRHVSTRKGFRNKIKRIVIKNLELYEDTNIDINSALVSICGRNGIGKTSLLKLLYKLISKENNNIGMFESSSIGGVEVDIEINGVNQIFVDSQDKYLETVEYFDSSSLALKIIDEIKSSPEKNGWFNTSSSYFYKDEDLFFIRKITGKKYEEVEVNEVEGIIDDIVFPYFKVKEKGTSEHYSSEKMGQGEHKLLISIWKLISVENNSIIFIEEPESFICPVSQTAYMDFLAYIIDTKKIHVVMATHSEHILRSQGFNSVLVLDKKSKKYSLSKCSDNYEYFNTLGLLPEKENIFLVEDDFAKLVLEYIFKENDIYLFATSYIHSLGGESNIKKIIEHYREHAGLNIVAVFDADQIHDDRIYSGSINKVFLPSTDRLSPEEEIILCIKEDITTYAGKLNLNADELHETIDSITCDHHDFFTTLFSTLKNKPLSTLKGEAIQIWVEKNIYDINKFIFCLRNINHKIKMDIKEKPQSEVFRYAESLDGLYKFKVDEQFNSFVNGTYPVKFKHKPNLGEIIVSVVSE